MLGTLITPEITQNITQIVRAQASTSTNDLEKEVVIFLGDCLECHFRPPRSDPFNKLVGSVMTEFCTKMKVNESGASGIKEMFDGTQLLVMLEAPLYHEIEIIRDIQRHASSLLSENDVPREHSWLDTTNMPYIGGNRSIIHTLRLLQVFTSDGITNVPDATTVEPKRGFYGPTPLRPGRARKKFPVI